MISRIIAILVLNTSKTMIPRTKQKSLGVKPDIQIISQFFFPFSFLSSFFFVLPHSIDSRSLIN